jgi:hypothetical protein
MINPAFAASELRLATLPDPQARPGPRAALVNQVATAGGVEITLLSYVLVDETLRLSGALRVLGHHDLVLATVPALDLSGGADRLRARGTHVLPIPPIIWLAWMFEYPPAERGTLMARIEQLELGFRTGRRTETVIGPWVFPPIAVPSHLERPVRRLAAIMP